MKVSIDQTKCAVCASCVAICPEVFEMKDDGTVDVKEKYQGKDIPEELESKVKESQSICPSVAIIIKE